MRSIALCLSLLAVSVSGCLDDEVEANHDTISDPLQVTNATPPISKSHIIDYSLKSNGFGTDLSNNPLCGQEILTLGRFHHMWELKREHGARVTPNHTTLKFELYVENPFSDIDYTGYRIGVYYNHELVFWTDSLKESTTFEYPLDGTMVDVDRDARWTFFFKRTDPLTEDDPDACTAGHEVQSILDIQVYAE